MFSPDFFHIASVYPKSTECIIQNIKKHHFYNYYFLAIDGRRLEFQKMAEDNKCDYVIYDNPLGGPVPPIGLIGFIKVLIGYIMGSIGL